MAGTVNPAEVFSTGESDASEDRSSPAPKGYYYTLEFPDMVFLGRKLRTVLGRYRGDSPPNEGPSIVTDYNLEPTNGLGFADDVHHQQLKRRKASDGGEDLSDSWETSWSNIGLQTGAPSDLLHTHRVTTVGGIGGPQIPSEDPDEDFCAVHPAVDEETGQLPEKRSISKRHLAIYWDEDYGWTLEVLGKNGVYVNEKFYVRGERVFLKEEDHLSLFGVGIYFSTKDIRSDLGDDSWDSDHAEEESEKIHGTVQGLAVGMADKDEEDDDVNDDDEDENADENEEDGEPVIKPYQSQESESMSNSDSGREDVERDEAEGVEERSSTAKATKKPKSRQDTHKMIKLTVTPAKNNKAEKRPAVKKNQAESRPSASSAPADPKEPVASVEAPQKRRGPGRPPADGIMSKRERRERQKALEAGVPYGDPLPTKPKRPRTDSEVNGDGVDASGSSKKPKKFKRDPSAIGGDETKQDLASELAEKNETTPPQLQRAPSPKESDFPPEKLAKPEETYQGLLYVVLSETTRPLALPQIYEAIKNKWPYFRFKPDTKGWESSVRHNLQSSQCFLKAGRAGKGYLWTVNPDVPFERKARKPSPPSNSIQPPYQPPRPTQHGMHLPVHGIYNQTYSSFTSQQASFMNGQRAAHLAQPFQQPTFVAGQQGSVIGQPSQQPSATNGQHVPATMPPSQVPLQEQVPPLNSYSSPYSLGSAPQVQAHQVANPRLPDGNFIASGGSNIRQPPPVNANPPNAFRPNPHPPGAQRSIPVSNVQTQTQIPPQRTQTPGTVGKQNAQPVGPIPREPLAANEIRQGRTPAVVLRFMAQLRRISGNDADRTIQQAQLALDWIMKHPDSDDGMEQDEQNVSKSMVTVLRNLILQQTASPQAIQKDNSQIPNRVSQTPAPVPRPVHALPTPPTPVTTATLTPAIPAGRATQQSPV